MARTKVDEMIYLTAVLGRGWTKAMVEDILGPPDELVANRHHRAGPSAKLYSLARVVRKEGTKKFQAAKAAADRRRVSSEKATTTKRGKLLDAIRRVPTPALPVLTREALLAGATASLPEYDHGAGEDRVMVNYARHKLTKYERLLDRAAGKTGVSEAHSLIYDLVFGAIAVAYPWLAAECCRQKEAKQTWC